MSNIVITNYPLEFKDDIDKWLFKEFGIMSGCCSGQGCMEYNTARAVAEKLWNKNK